ncbi:hypothetical protein OEB99_08365 [Actinotalea sp. M2MS4P-6]|uniref:hypothetical protein n=1 Tax=Actinotalea sp. M2MS4P-6 TaxID=2983762 RepID=UPI0021E45D57|nr:hypothetical protein [Actinotalea sp. M2MS4P-6]MCV2394320.1 hypothetical protein [Actinotalea sp. M2MS4P-6]
MRDASLRAAQHELETTHWRGPVRRYDIVKEGVIAFAVVAVVVVGLSSFLGSPDEPALTFQGWATAMPNDFYDTTVSELAGTSESATYGPPYNDGGTGQTLGPINLQALAGIRIPVDPANDFVIQPLQTQQQPADVVAALDQWTGATAEQQSLWASTYETALGAADGDPTAVGDGDYGPVPVLASGLEQMAASGALDGVLAAPGSFYSTDNTKQILFMGDGGYLDAAASANELQGNQWGMMNETGAYPGQQWLAPFSFWYQLPIFNSEADSGFAANLTANADIVIMVIVVVFTLVVMLLPFIPGLRDLPRAIGLHRVIWRRYYAGAKERA